MKKIYNLDLVIIITCILVIITQTPLLGCISVIYATIKYIKNKDLKKYILSLFFIYITIILYFAVFSDFYHRNFIGMEWNFVIFKQYIKACNFVPLKTIIFYIQCFFNFSEEINTLDIFVNLIGNFICLIPLSFFIPYFEKKEPTRLRFSVYLLLISFGIEIIQLITMAGSFDIDDVILNSAGSIIIYFYYFKEIKLIKNNKKRIFDRNNLKVIIRKILFMLTMFFTIVICFLLREVRNENFWKDYHFERIELINYKDVCDTQIKNKIYEDELYNYYIQCNNIDKIKIEINSNKFYLKEYLDGETIYPIIMHKLEDTGIEIIKEEKNEKIIVCPQKTLAVNYKIRKNEIAEVVLSNHIEKNGEKCLVYFIIPKKIGETDVIFEIDDKEILYNILVKQGDKEYKVTTKMKEIT